MAICDIFRGNGVRNRQVRTVLQIEYVTFFAIQKTGTLGWCLVFFRFTTGNRNNRYYRCKEKAGSRPQENIFYYDVVWDSIIQGLPRLCRP